MTAITLRMNAGVPGAVTRSYPGQVISQEVINPSTPPTYYGQPVKMVSGQVQPLASADAASAIYGITVRPYPTQDNSGTSPAYGGGQPPASGIIDVMRVGFIAVSLGYGTAARGGQVNVRTTVVTGPPNYAIGDIEDASYGSGTVTPANWFFTGAADAAANVEISLGIPGS